MIRKSALCVGILLATAAVLPADFTYQQTSTITGGMVATMMKVAGVFSKSAREPIRTTVSVKGDRMVSRSADDASIIDVNAETITEVNFKKKQYSVMTFQEMKQALEAAAQKAKRGKQGDEPQMNFKVSVDPTGKTQTIAGQETKEMVLKMEMESTDPKSGQKGSMVVTSDMWLAPGMNGYGEVREFYRKMSEKINWTPGGNMFMAQPEVSEGMAGLYKEAAKLDGVPVLQLVSMGAAVPPGQAGQGDAQAAPPPQQEQQAERPGLGGMLGGKLGGLGGLGRRRNQPKEEEKPKEASAGAGNPGSLLEMKTELTDFSTAAVDDAQFTVPASFKKVDADLKKMK